MGSSKEKYSRVGTLRNPYEASPSEILVSLRVFSSSNLIRSFLPTSFKPGLGVRPALHPPKKSNQLVCSSPRLELKPLRFNMNGQCDQRRGIPSSTHRPRRINANVAAVAPNLQFNRFSAHFGSVAHFQEPRGNPHLDGSNSFNRILGRAADPTPKLTQRVQQRY